jgi:hypothetical protein
MNDMYVVWYNAQPDFLRIMIGTTLAHYEITTHLGSGGMGERTQVPRYGTGLR